MNVPNIQFCRDKGKLGAVCAYWQNAKETKIQVPYPQWNKNRFGMVCTSERGMGNINATIEKLCQNQKCIEQTKELIKAIE